MHALQKHSEIMQQFETERNSLPSLKARLKNDTNNQTLIDQIDMIESSKEETEYLMHTAGIIYEIQKEIKNCPEDKSSCSVLGKRKISNAYSNMNDFVQSNQKFSDKCMILQEKFNKIIEQYFPHRVTYMKTKSVKKVKKIENWNNQNDLGEKLLLCPTCGNTRYIIDAEAKIMCVECSTYETYDSKGDNEYVKESADTLETTPFSYQRISHFNGWLNQFQAKEKTHIPFDILNEVNNEFKKAGKSTKNIDVKTVKTYLKKLSKKNSTSTGSRNSTYTKLYEHSAQIVHLLGGKPPPELTPLQEEKLRTMFKQIQEPFEMVKPSGRKNFLSYAYVFVKMVELLGWTDLKNCFTLLKSREKLIQQDIIWKDICAILEWKYYPSI